MSTFTITKFAATLCLSASLLSTTAFAASHSSPNPMVGGAAMFAEKNIIENAVNSADHTTLVAAVKAAGLVDTLMTDGPFTVFAPVNDAFAALPEGAVANLLKPENKDQLVKVLTCHVVGANAMSDAIGKMIADDKGVHAVKTLGGCVLQAKMDGENITLSDENGRVATVTIADVKQSNGVIHVIDTVLLPATEPKAAMKKKMMKEETVIVGGEDMFPSKNIVENAVKSKDHTTLVAAVVAADLAKVLTSKGPFTVFAPVNNAFEDLPEGTVESLLKPESKGTLQSILTYHVVAGAFSKDDLAEKIKAGGGSATLNTASGGTLKASFNGPSNVVITDTDGGIASISTYDIFQSNGVIHSIDAVLLP